MKKHLKKQEGFTLLEVILSLSLLSIVLLVFIGFFIQANTFSAKSEEKMSASQLSQEVLEKVKSSSFLSTLNKDNWITLYPDPNIGKVDSNGEFYLQVNNQTFYPKATIETKTSLSSQLKFIKIEISVKEKGAKVKKYETYGFK
jgi:prepilin-type N-terminal cleavage/methylation domain-containing protein